MMDPKPGALEEAFPAMVFMLQYYHMNWIDEPRYKPDGVLHPDHVILHFIEAARPSTRTAARSELRRLLEMPYTENELDRILDMLYVNIRPSFRGLTIRQWLEHLGEILDGRS